MSQCERIDNGDGTHTELFFGISEGELSPGLLRIRRLDEAGNVLSETIETDWRLSVGEIIPAGMRVAAVRCDDSPWSIIGYECGSS